MQLLESGYSPQARAGDTLSINTYWNIESPVLDNYSFTVTLRDSEQNNIISDRQFSPGGIETQNWRADQYIYASSSLLLPSTLLPGQYTLILNVLNAATGDLVQQVQPSGTIGDVDIIIGSIQIGD